MSYSCRFAPRFRKRAVKATVPITTAIFFDCSPSSSPGIIFVTSCDLRHASGSTIIAAAVAPYQ